MKRVLIADDNPHIVRILSEGLERALEDTAFKLETSADGASALSQLESSRFDLAILDLFMPHLDGLRLISRVRENPNLAALRILVVTAGGEEGVRDALEVGADAALTKPLRLHDITDAVRTLLRV